jgi:putative endonuclease
LAIPMSRTYYVYILASKSRRLYIGVTNDLSRRMWEHKNKVVEGFTKQYNIDRLVYFEDTTDVKSAIDREKQLEGWRREKKITLIETVNAAWEDLSVQLQLIDIAS